MASAREFYTGLRDAIESMVKRALPYRAVAKDTNNGLVQIQPLDADAPMGEYYARLSGPAIKPNDEVAVVDLGGKPFVLGKIQRTNTNSVEFDQDIWIVKTDTEAFQVADDTNAKVFGVNTSPTVAQGRGVKVYDGSFLSGLNSNGTITFNLDARDGSARFDGTVSIDGVTANRANLTHSTPIVYWQAASDVGSTTNTSTFQTAITRNINLGAGTWDVTVFGGSMLRHSNGQGIAYRIVTGNQTGNTLVQTFYGDSYTYGLVGHNATNQSGTITVRYQYRSNSEGTSTSKAPFLIVMKRRTG